MSALLQPLFETMGTVRERIKLARADGGWNEAQTRASLIDPILTVLGWDAADPTLVLHEITVAGGRADYALREDEDHLAAIVEAKALGKSAKPKRRGTDYELRQPSRSALRCTHQW